VLLGTSLLYPRPSSPHGHHQVAGLHLHGAGLQLTSAALSADSRATLPAAGVGAPVSLLRPVGARYVEAAWAWSAYVAAHTPAAPARPAPAQPATYHVATPVAPATRPAAGDVWAGLRRCESGGNYAEDTGNGYYGAYQFSAATWHGLGFPGLPSDASPAVQDEAAQQLQARSGWGQWPNCSRLLRLT
jgi:hypothetical protein